MKSQTVHVCTKKEEYSENNEILEARSISMRSQIIAKGRCDEIYLKQLKAVLDLKVGDRLQHEFRYAHNDSNSN